MKSVRRVWAAILALGVAAPATAQFDEEFGGPSAYLDKGRFYVSPMFSYVLADNDRGTEDGFGGSLAIGRKITSGMTLELIGHYMQMDPDGRGNLADNGTFKLYAAGIGAMIFPVRQLPNLYGRLNLMRGSGQNHPGVIVNYDSTVFDSGIGYLFAISPRIALRAEALYRMDHHNRRLAGLPSNNAKDFYDGVFSLGLVVPLGTRETEPLDPDSDGDGVPDSLDQCPGTPPGVVVDATGCPLDSDGDGVPDYLDQCPDTPAGVQVDAVGCPIDSDGDGIPDYLDECPNSPRGAQVMADGCALEGDCRRPRPGEEVDERGCAVGGFILKGVKFEFDSDRLTEEAKRILDRVAETLNAYPEIDVDVEGHTDFIGSDAYNLGLSERRALAVKNYLISRGVAAERMTPIGYGRSRPIADNSTEEGREENRRVELKPRKDF